MKKVFAVVFAVLFLVGGTLGGVATADTTVSVGVKEAYVSGGQAQHFATFGLHSEGDSVDGFTPYFDLDLEYSNETIEDLDLDEADGISYKIGATYDLGNDTEVDVSFSDEQPFTGTDIRTTSISLSKKF